MPLDPLTAQAIMTAGSQLTGGIFGYIGQRQTNKTNLKLAEDDDGMILTCGKCRMSITHLSCKCNV